MLEKQWLNIQPYGFQKGLSYLAGKLAFCEIPLVKNWIIQKFLRDYPTASLSDALETDPLAYRSFMALFARELQPTARPLPKDINIIASPCDGRLMQMGTITNDTLVTAKGYQYTVPALMGNVEAARLFDGGIHATFYLAPTDYHRVHMPTDGRVQEMTYVPGNLFSVQPKIIEHVPDLFTRNTRVAVVFDTPFGPMGLVFVAAFLVSGVHIRWAGAVSACNKKTWHYSNTADKHIQLKQGDECGYFYFGSSIVMLLPKGATLSEKLTLSSHYKMGENLGTFR